MQLLQQYSWGKNVKGRGERADEHVLLGRAWPCLPWVCTWGGQVWCFGWCHMAPGLQSDKHRDNVCHCNRKISLFLSFPFFISSLFSLSSSFPSWKLASREESAIKDWKEKKKLSILQVPIFYLFNTLETVLPRMQGSKERKMYWSMRVGMEWKQISWAPMLVS